jgi:hypothetical protein
MNITDILAGRSLILSSEQVILVAIEALLESVSGLEPSQRRRSGCFRNSSWYTPDFLRSDIPEIIRRRKSELERQSSWLRGGPK